MLSDDEFIQELRRIKVWNYGKCELGLWADILDRLDGILENAATRVGVWTIKVDLPENEKLVEDVVTVLEFTGHLIEHSIYRCLYGSWNHILTLFGSSNMDILLAVLGLTYNFSKRSNYFSRLDAANKKMILDRLISIAETWGGSESHFDLASCCQSDHFPPTAGNIYFEYQPEVANPSNHEKSDGVAVTSPNTVSLLGPGVIIEDLKGCRESPSQIMETILEKHPVPVPNRMALFARIRLAVYFSDPEKRSKCIRARLQAISTLCYTFEINDRLLYPSLVDELVDVLQLPDGEFMEIKACALRTMTAIFSSHRVNVNLMSILESTGMSSFHGALPTRIRKWIQGLVDGSCDAAGGSVNQQYTIALLSFLYHLASFEENIGSGSGQNHATTLSTSGILDSMLQLIAWHVPRNDCLSYVTRAVRVTDQILMNAATNRQTVVNRLVDRLGYEVDLVLSNNGPGDETGSQASLLNTQRSGLMKSILNLLKRLCLDTDWNDAVRTSMENNLPQILSSIYKNSVFHFTPHLALFAMETITNYIYTYPSRISNMQDSGITCGILSALTTQPLPQNRDFLVHLPSILNTLALNTRGRAALRSCGILNKYLETLVSPDYLSTMKARRVRDFHSQIYSLAPSAGQAFSTNLTASQMSNSIQELLRSHNELKPTVFQSLVECFRKVVRLGCSQSAPILPPPETLGSNELEGEGSCRSFNQSYPTHTRNLNVFSSENRSGGRMTVTSAAVIDATNPAASRTAGGVLLDEDLVMLSGSEDNGSAEDDDDNDDMPDVSLTASRTTVSSNTSFLTSTTRTELIATNASSASERHITATDGDTPDQKPSSSAEASTFSDVPDSFQNLPEYILNLCKFVERLLPSMQHVTEGMCRQFVNQGGLQVLCDLLTMPGLPYDFPVSAACASLCKIFEQLVSYLSLNDLLKPVLQALQDGLSKVDNFLTSETAEYSVLLRDCSANETNVLHGLVCISSILCVLVQIINHLKSEHRCGFASFWVQRNISGQLGKLYHKVSWEAVILLKTICDESKDHNQSGPSTGCSLSVDPNEACGSTQASQSKPSLSMPAFVEALSVYRILKPCLQAHQSAKTKSLAHYILHVCSYFINSVTELCTTLTRFCVASPSQPQRRLLMSSFDQVPLSLKTSVLTQVAQLAIGALCWQPPDSIVNNSEFLLIFNDLASLNSSTDFLSGALSSVLEEWFACVNRLSNIAAVRAEVKKISETDAIHFDTDKYAHYVSRLSLQPLELLCCHGVLLNYLSQRAVEHLLNMLINIVQYVFTEEPDQLADVEGSEKPASGDGTPAPLKTGATSVNPEPDSTPVIAAGDSETPSRTSESSRAAVRMLEEMGFAARTAELALEESNWNTADAVNLLLLSLDDFAPFNFNPSGVAPERPAALFPFPNEVEAPNSVPVQTSGALLDSLIYEASSRGPAEESLWVPLTSDYPAASSTVVPMTDAEVERLRESLRKNIFPACYAIARLHKTDEILHQISELMLCSKQETQCIENLVAAVTTNLFASLGVLLPTRSSPVADTGVGLHLIALLFTRCRFICAQIVHKYSLISVLTALLTGDVDALLSHPLPVLLNLGESSTTPSQCVSSQSLVALDGDENLLMLAAIILDQYERTVGVNGVLPKSFSIATPLETSANDATVDLSPELNSHQKQIVAFIIEALVKPLTPTGILKAPAQTHDGCSRVPTVVGGNGTASKVTSDSEAQSQEDNPEELLPLYVGLAKQDYLRYLVDLAITSRRVAEFISKYIYDGVKGTTDRSSFVSYLFATELQEQANMELTVLLLETLAFNTSLPTQSAIISEFKSSLRDIVSEGLAPLNNPDEGHKRNQRIIAHMRFLDQLLFLPPPTSVHIIKQIYKRQIPCDIAKLLALVNCNLTNTQQTLNFLVKVLEVLTESAQHNRPDLSAPGRPQQRRQNYVTVMTTVADNLHSATETANPVMSSLAPSVEGEPMLVDLTPPTSSNSRRAAAPVSTQENSPHQQHPPAEGMEHVDTTESRSPEESSSAADIHAQASDLSFSESVFSRGDIVLHSLTGLQDLSRQGMRQSSDTWALAETASDQDDSEGGNTENGLLILDDDDEDEGSAGQGGETDNSQDGGEEDVEDRQDLSGSTRRRNSDSFDRYSIEDDDDHGDHSDGRSLSVFSRNQLSPILGGVSIENSDLMEGTRRVSADEEDPEDSFREEDDDDDDGEDDDDDGGDDDEDDDDEAEDSDWNVLDQAYEHTANDEEDSAREAVLTVRGLSLPPVDQANRSENTNLMAALVSDVLNPVDVPPPWSHQLAYAPNQHRSVRRDRDRDGFLLQFSTVGSGGTGGHGLSRHDIGWAVSRPRSFFDFSFGIPAGANGVPITSNVFPGLVNANFTPSISQATESMMFGSHAATFSGGGALSVAQTNALQNLQPSLPTQHPLLQYPHAHYALGDVSLRNGGSSAGGFSNSPALRHQPYMSTPNASNNLSSSREGPVISILLPSSRVAVSASDSVSAGGRMDSLSPCLLFSILTNFRRLIDVCRILYGQEVMDMILLSRFEVGLHAIRRRGDEFRERLAAHQASVVNATGAAEATGETTLGHSSAAAQVPLLTPTNEDKSSRAGPSDDRDTQAANEAEWAEPHVPSNLISSVRPQASMEHQDANRSDQDIAGILTSSEAVPASSPEQTTAGDAQSRTLTPSTGTASVVTEEVHVPVTDEETIASMVAEGMDPSFLDALPEDVRRELLADHRRTRQLRSQLSSMQLPEHVSAEFLSSLPPSIQEEVLTQVRQETQRQAGSDDTQNQSTARAGDAANGPEATPENNAAFLASLPPSVRREVLADMEDFQIDLLPPDLQQEARTLRREHEAQFARAVQGRSLPGLFRPRLDTTYFWQTLSGFGRWDSRAGGYNRFIRNGETPVLGSRGPSAFSGLQSLFSGRNRHLLDHEGLTCILTLLVVSSACPVQRRHTVPALKRVLRNLASQPGIRNWIICTILSLLKRLSEKPLPPDYSVGCSRSSASTQSALCGPMANSLFAAGFEAALGCWVRIFHPIPALSAQPPPLADESAPGPSTSKPISADFVYIVHPQAVNLVCSTLLDAIADLARNCPPQFFPLAPHASQCQEYTSETTQPPDDLQDVPELQTDFWDILARLNKVPPSLCNSEQSQKPAAATSPSTSSALNRSSQRKPRTSGAVSGSSRRSHPPVTRSRNHQQPTDAPANANTALPENGANVKPKRNSPTSADVDTDVCCLDYFSQLANLLRHPVISCRPPLQEKLLSILVGVVREFCKRSRALNQPSTTTESFINRGDVGPVNTIAEATTSGATPSQYAADPVASSSAVSGDAPERITKKPVTDLMLCPQPAVIECLCELVVAAKTTEQARSLSVRLVILIAQANATTKAQMLGYLCAAASDLSAIISRQLKVVINEVDNLPPSAKASLPSNSKTTIPLSASMTRLSSVSDPGVSDAADVNDRSLAPTSVISVASSSTAPPPTVSELELSSLQPLTTSRSEQSRLCCVLHLILHMLSCGSEGISTDDPPTKVTMESIDGLSQLWEDLSHTLDRLETTNDANTVLLLQPLVESLCLAHSTVLRENNTVRRLSRVSTIGAVPSGISFFPNLLPPEADLYEMPPITNASPAFGQSSTNAGAEPLSPAPIIDLNRPMSPPLINLPNAPDTVPDTASSPIARLAETHRTSLNHILRNFSGNLSESSFVAFLSYPRALDFDIKRRFFRQRLQALANRDGSVSRFEDEPVVVSRGRIFEDSYARLHRKSASEWKHKFVIRFQNEEGQDAGGLLREWYLLMSREIFNPNYCLFRVSPADRVTYTINPASFINSNHLSYFKFVGRFIGKAIYDNKLLECYFTRSFYKHMLGVRVRFVDLESEDYDFYKGLEFLLKHDVSELGYDVTFSTEINEFGKNETRDLIEDGRNIIVTEANKNEYVRLVCQERMTGAIRQQLNAFLEGFYEIIPKSLISIFNEQELELLISGLPNIDIEDLKANTTYSKYQPNSPQVRWFWRALESFDQEDRARFLQFITGTSKVPLGGFANLEGMHGPTKFQISRAVVSSINHLPSAHTCFNTLELPPYESYEQLRERLLTAIRECSEGYGMA
nr:unnamed protein product [Spirometra erinaceieuropaei]